METFSWDNDRPEVRSKDSFLDGHTRIHLQILVDMKPVLIIIKPFAVILLNGSYSLERGVGFCLQQRTLSGFISSNWELFPFLGKIVFAIFPLPGYKRLENNFREVGNVSQRKIYFSLSQGRISAIFPILSRQEILIYNHHPCRVGDAWIRKS